MPFFASPQTTLTGFSSFFSEKYLIQNVTSIKSNDQTVMLQENLGSCCAVMLRKPWKNYPYVLFDNKTKVHIGIDCEHSSQTSFFLQPTVAVPYLGPGNTLLIVKEPFTPAKRKEILVMN